MPEDLAMIESAKLYYDDDGALGNQDYLAAVVRYSEEEYPEDQLEDLERLLSRRLSSGNAKIIMDYIRAKQGWYEHLEQKVKWFYIEGYDIKVYDAIQFEGTINQLSENVEIQMWYK